MADNVAITAGTGTDIATDDAGAAGHVQIIKLAVSADGSATPITAVAGGLSVIEPSAAAALTAVQLIDDIVYVDDTATHSTGTSKGALVMAAATPTDGSVSANDIGALAMTTDRKLHVAVMDALPAGSAAIGKLAANSGVDIGDVDVTSILPGTAATSLGKAVDSASGATDTGVTALFVVDAALSAISPSDNDYAQGRVDANGAQWVHVSNTEVGSTTDTEDGTIADGQSSVALTVGMTYTWDGDNWTRAGSTIFRSIDLDETEEEIKATAGILYGYAFSNTNATARYLHFYNATAANVTVGSTASVYTIYMPATCAGHISFGANGLQFGTAITAAATTDVAGSGAPGANDVLLMAFYK